MPRFHYMVFLDAYGSSNVSIVDESLTLRVNLQLVANSLQNDVLVIPRYGNLPPGVLIVCRVTAFIA